MGKKNKICWNTRSWHLRQLCCLSCSLAHQNLDDLSGYLDLMGIPTCCLHLEHLHSSASLPGAKGSCLPLLAPLCLLLGFFIQPRLVLLLPAKALIAIFNNENLIFFSLGRNDCFVQYWNSSSPPPKKNFTLSLTTELGKVSGLKCPDYNEYTRNSNSYCIKKKTKNLYLLMALLYIRGMYTWILSIVFHFLEK